MDLGFLCSLSFFKLKQILIPFEGLSYLIFLFICLMLEAVGHEFMEAFFGCCESVLADDGLLVLQVMIGWKQESLYSL